MWQYGTIAAVVLTVLAFVYWRMERKTKRIVTLESENRMLKNNVETLQRIGQEWERLEMEAREHEAKSKGLSPADRHSAIRGM